MDLTLLIGLMTHTIVLGIDDGLISKKSKMMTTLIFQTKVNTE